MPLVRADAALLTAGIRGAVVLSVFSTALPVSGFLLPRTVPATAVLFAEPTSISRTDNHNHDPTCNRPIINLGSTISSITTHPFIDLVKSNPVVDRVRQNFDMLQSILGDIKMRLPDHLDLACVIPRLSKPIQPLLDKISCTLGLDEDAMESAKCNEVRCEDSGQEEKQISHDLGPVPMKVMNLKVETMSDCFQPGLEITYGVRILAKLQDDASCDNLENTETCQRLIEEGRVIQQESCTTEE